MSGMSVPVVAHTVLGGRIHLPLRVVESHMAGFTRFRLTSFFHGEGVTCVACVAGRVTVDVTICLQLSYLLFGFSADFVATTAAFLTINQLGRIPVNRRHGLHRRPSE